VHAGCSQLPQHFICFDARFLVSQESRRFGPVA
jgi:hypothetical protein